jgi:hypothetical protein
MFGTMVLDLIDAGIFEAAEMINLYEVSFWIVMPRAIWGFADGKDGKVMREQIGQLHEQFWAIIRTALNRYSMHGGGRRSVGTTTSTAGTVTGADANNGKHWDSDTQLFTAFARWDGRTLFNLEVGSYRYKARSGVGGRSDSLITNWFAEEKMDMQETPGVKRLDCEFVIPAFAMDKHRHASKSFQTFKKAYGLEEGRHFAFDPASKTDTSPGDCVFFCTEAGARELKDCTRPKILRHELTVSGAKKVETEMAVTSESDFSKAVVKNVTRKTTRWVAPDSRVKERSSKPVDEHPSKGANRQMCEDLFYKQPSIGIPTTDLRPMLSKMNAQLWKNEVARLHCTHEEVALPSATSGSAANGWPAELVMVHNTVDEDELLEADALLEARQAETGPVDSWWASDTGDSAGAQLQEVMKRAATGEALDQSTWHGGNWNNRSDE